MIKRICTLRYRPSPQPRTPQCIPCPSIQMGAAIPSYMLACVSVQLVQNLDQRGELKCPAYPRLSNPLFIKDSPSLRQHPPILPDKSLVSLPHPQYRYHIYICTQHHSPLQDPKNPSIHLLLSASCHLMLSFLDRGIVAFGEPAHSQDNVGLWCVGSQSRGNNGYLLGREALQLRGNESEHLPTGGIRQYNPNLLTMIWTYTFHPKPPTTIHHLEKVFILFTSEPAEFGDFEVGPEMAHIVLLSFHSLRINGWQRSSRRIASQNLLWEGVFVIRIILWQFVCLLRLRLNEHFP